MIRLSAFFASGVLRAPRTPCGRARPAPASDGVAVLARAMNGVSHYIEAVTIFTAGTTSNVLFFVRCDSRRSTPGGCFPQRSLTATNRLFDYMRAILRNLFRRPCATFYGRAGLRFGRAPQGVTHPLTRGRARPAPARLHLFWRSRAYASHTLLATEKTSMILSSLLRLCGN